MTSSRSELVSRAADVALSAAREASQLVMSVYGAPFEVEYKTPDDPVTSADRRSNDLLCERLGRAFAEVPVVAEESQPGSYSGFAGADAIWFVDPLDGTREFVARNGEFAVMVGLALDGRAALGVIVAPAWKRTFLGIVGEGAWELSETGERTAIRVSRQAKLEGAATVLSRSRASPKLSRLAMAMTGREGVSHGSSGLKGVLVATGAYDLYLQPGRAGMRWDACATDALVRAAGGTCTDAMGRPFEYRSNDLANRDGLVASNGLIHDAAVAALAAARHA